MRYMLLLIIIAIGWRIEYATHQAVDKRMADYARQLDATNYRLAEINYILPMRYRIAIPCGRCHR